MCSLTIECVLRASVALEDLAAHAQEGGGRRRRRKAEEEGEGGSRAARVDAGTDSQKSCVFSY